MFEVEVLYAPSHYYPLGVMKAIHKFLADFTETSLQPNIKRLDANMIHLTPTFTFYVCTYIFF